jgi:uncharacterized membrane protein
MKIQLGAVLSTSLLASIASAAEYAFTQVDYPGVVSTQIFSINDRGDAVGNGLTDPASVSAAPFVYRWKRGGFKQLPMVSSDTSTHVLGINDAGVVVGSVFSLESAVARAFIRGTDGAYTLLFHPDAENMTEAGGSATAGS